MFNEVTRRNRTLSLLLYIHTLYLVLSTYVHAYY